MTKPICELCTGNGFISDDDNAYSACPICIPEDIATVPAKTNSRTHILDRANELITGDRADTHGDAVDTFKKIADYCSTYLGQPIDPKDVANLMVLLKVVRAQQSPRHKDNWVDQAGYAALGWEVSQ